MTILCVSVSLKNDVAFLSDCLGHTLFLAIKIKTSELKFFLCFDCSEKMEWRKYTVCCCFFVLNGKISETFVLNLLATLSATCNENE